MKKLYSCVFFLIVSIVQAQTDQVTFGIKGGVNISTITDKPIFANKIVPRISYHIGGFIEIPISDNFAFQPELLYSEKGSRYTSEIEFRASPNEIPVLVDQKLVTKLNYLTVPLLFKHYFSEEWAIYIGPQVGYLISAKQKSELSERIDNFPGDFEIDARDGFKDFDFGAKIALEYSLENGMFFQGMYSRSVTKINEFDGPLGSKHKNSVIQLSVGYKFQ